MDRWRRMGRRARPWILGALATLLAIQLVPFGRDHSNPAATERPPWPSDRAAVIFDRACADCHSNATRWPWYAHVAPASWLLTIDVRDGRDELNVSHWNDDAGEADDAVETILEGSMPPRRYLLLHPDARLSEDEARILIDALRAMDD